MKNNLSCKNNLEKFRVDKGLSQKDLANLVGISVETVSLIENGSLIPTLRLATTLSTALDKKFGEVFLFC
ncbi:MAG: helix-turn-helix domain-containing protein [Parvimonas sp.]|uniref:helix-turn-helix transcriptional regulator n=1 Tax=Parvimonas sp. TaxID=1944660 RepID=UPI002A753B39|nr:helix-turn-helix domain-containing protein [Parvimonas sp.]MDY3050475.1 helix-turn-helix domain-containing protein [Parvimonas sp.]